MRPLLLCLILTCSMSARAGGYRSVDACFVLDTTGSMSSSIQAAREKIWFIANQIVRAPGNPSVRLCLMAFRDRGDEYVTRLLPLTAEIDHVHDRLNELVADGGGDHPEAVFQALYETVVGAGWTPSDDSLRVIFLIGDAPPKQYPDEPGYADILREASQRGVVINPVLAGSNEQARKTWQALDHDSPGRMIELPVVRTSARIETPLDQDLVALDSRLRSSHLPYAPLDSEPLPPPEDGPVSEGSLVDRLEYGAATGRVFHRRGDLLQDLDSGVITLEHLANSALPPALRSMTQAELEARLGKIRAEREALASLIDRLLSQRRELLSHQASEGAFEQQVAELILEQISSPERVPTSKARPRPAGASH